MNTSLKHECTRELLQCCKKSKIMSAEVRILGLAMHALQKITEQDIKCLEWKSVSEERLKWGSLLKTRVWHRRSSGCGLYNQKNGWMNTLATFCCWFLKSAEEKIQTFAGSSFSKWEKILLFFVWIHCKSDSRSTGYNIDRWEETSKQQRRFWENQSGHEGCYLRSYAVMIKVER